MNLTRYAYLLILLFLFSIEGRAQRAPSVKMLYYDSVKTMTDTCMLPPSITIKISNDTLVTAFRKALSYYPELQGIKIRLKYGKIKTSMTSAPRLFSIIFRKRAKRTYNITVNKTNCSAAQVIYMAPFNAQVGVMGHELAHVADYIEKSGWQMIGFGIRYLNKEHRRQIERQTDSTAMSKGLNWQIYDFSHFVFYKAELDSAYRQYKHSIYMKPEEVYKMAVQMDSLALAEGR